MKHLSTKTVLAVCIAMMTVALSSCDMMHEERDDCPIGLYVAFKYDYNLQRADMFNDHVGSVTLYVFDEQGRFVKTQEESNTASAQPLKNRNYLMHVDGLQPGKYQFIALAGQTSYAEQLKTNRAKFIRKDMTTSNSMTDLEVLLDHVQATGTDATKYGTDKFMVENNDQPLDTLWHGIKTDLVEVYDTKPTYDTISLVRDTKMINITLRELDDPTEMDVNNYEFRIEDRNAHILYNNDLDETDNLVYTPYAEWNTEDRITGTDNDGNQYDTQGKIGHASFMTSRILYHDLAKDDAVLVITDKRTGEEVIKVNVADYLSRETTYEDRIYTRQGFLDRGYNYQMHFYLKGGKFEYATINISVLAWTIRYQNEELTH